MDLRQSSRDTPNDAFGSAPGVTAKDITLKMATELGAAGTELEMEIRGKRLPAQVVRPPFARNGKAVIKV